MKALELKNEEVLKVKEGKKEKRVFITGSKKRNLLIEKGRIELVNPLNFLR
ncbi:MAG: hypothetical protein ACPLWB_03090 [Caldisericia bacterium]